MQHIPGQKSKQALVNLGGKFIHRGETTGINYSAERDERWIEFIDNRAKAHGLFKETGSNRLDPRKEGSDEPAILD